MALQARTEFAAALNQIASEKGVDVSVVIDAIEQAALAAFRKDLSLRGEAIPEDFEELVAKINPASGEISILRGEENITPPGFARIAAQTARQVIAQKLHEAEKGALLDEYAKKVGTVISGTVQRQEGSTYYVDLGRAEGILPMSEQVRDEMLVSNQRAKFFIKEIRESSHGPEVILSRSDAGLIKGLFSAEVPEIQAGTVEIKVISREAGGRTKVAAISTQDGIDPVGSLVGQKGVRVQTVINEIGDEKIDILPYSDEPTRFIASALSPAKEVTVTLDAENQVARVKVPSSQLSLAIGKGGQNVRLAAKLTGWKIDIEGTEEEGEEAKDKGEGGSEKGKAENKEKKDEPVEKKVEEEELAKSEKLKASSSEEAQESEPETVEKETKEQAEVVEDDASASHSTLRDEPSGSDSKSSAQEKADESEAEEK